MGAVRLRAKLEDFVVDELVPERIPQEGEHLHVRIEKRGLSTEEAVKRMARALGVRPGHVGRCGRKDVRALARQWLSFAGVSERDVEALDLEDVRVLEHVRLPRKLRKGRFLGNRFRLRLRELPSGAEARARQGLQELAVRGLRNAFGPQRLGPGGLNARIGAELIAGELRSALHRIVDGGEGRLVERVRHHLGGDRVEEALETLGRRRAGFYVSAFQAQVFNRALAERGEAFDQALAGDVLFQHSSGRTLSIDDLDEARSRVHAFELSPTGPLPGPRLEPLANEAGEIEARALEGEGVPAGAAEERRPWFGCTGTRRPLRVPVSETSLASGSDELGHFLELGFVLPPGAFATTLVEALFPDG